MNGEGIDMRSFAQSALAEVYFRRRSSVGRSTVPPSEIGSRLFHSHTFGSHEG